MASRKSLRPAEWMLLPVPILLVGAIFWGRTVREKYFPAPVPTPTPTPVPKPTPSLATVHVDMGSFVPSRDGKTIYSVGRIDASSKLLNAWDAKTGYLLRSFSAARTHSSSGLALSDDGKRLAYTADGSAKKSRIGVYDAHKGVCLRYVSRKTGFATPIFLPRAHVLFLGMHGKFEVWDADKGKLLKHVAWLERDALESLLMSPSCTPDGKHLAVVRSEIQSAYSYANGRRDEIGIFRTRNWRRARTFSWPNTTISRIGFVNNGRTLVARTTTWRWAKPKSGKNDIYPVSSLLLLDWQTGTSHVVRQLSEWRSNGFSVSPDGRFFAVVHSFSDLARAHTGQALAEGANFIEIRESVKGRKIASLRVARDPSVEALFFASDNSALFYADYTLKTWARKQWKVGSIEEVELQR